MPLAHGRSVDPGLSFERALAQRLDVRPAADLGPHRGASEGPAAGGERYNQSHHRSGDGLEHSLADHDELIHGPTVGTGPSAHIAAEDELCLPRMGESSTCAGQPASSQYVSAEACKVWLGGI